LSYQVLARKWRPRDFESLVGQEHVVRALTNGLREGRLHHAFLFTGTRGVGKTTIARILAKSLNCERGVSATPCGECEHCLAIDQGRFVDLLEIDAASRTRVDDTREILDNVQYAPARGRFKVYLIDEVHMLSTHSFNALLKTLEEPPDHVKFVLATTDPQKIPVTILSRCMQFNLKRLDADQISRQLDYILGHEGISPEPAAVSLLARAADGSMRDGLSLLDQALAAGNGKLAVGAVEDMLGTVEQRHLHDIIEALIEGDPGAALEALAEVFGLARELARLLDDLAETLHRIALIQQVPDYRDDSRADWDQLVGMASRLDPEEVQLYYQIAVTGRGDLAIAPSQRTGCEMTLLRMFAFEQAAPVQSDSARGTATPKPVGGSGVESGPDRPGVADSGARSDVPAAGAGGADRKPGDVSSELTPDTWPSLLKSLRINGSVRAVAGMLALSRADDKRVEFRVARDDLQLVTDRFKASLARALNAATGQERRLEFRPVDDGAALTTPARLDDDERARAQADAEAAVAEDPVVRRMRDQFGAEVVPGSVRPADSRSEQ